MALIKSEYCIGTLERTICWRYELPPTHNSEYIVWFTFLLEFEQDITDELDKLPYDMNIIDQLSEKIILISKKIINPMKIYRGSRDAYYSIANLVKPPIGEWFHSLDNK